ncbi:MAG: ammonium transporter [Cyanobacteria bacterium P01_B01_bin.77]
MLDLDIIWVVGCSGLVLLMQPGFMCLESGLTRSKNSINVAIKNLADLGLSICFFWTFGFALMFGTSLFGWIGGSGFFVSVESNPKLAAFFIFQMLFCGTATTITSGALAERLKFKGYLAIAMLISGLIYPLFGHWVWNGINIGTSTGWLRQLGFADFAGASVVHSIGGWVSLAALLVVGPRTGRLIDSPDSQPSRRRLRKIHGSNLPFSVLGTMLLWVGWLGFNGGSTYALNDQIPGIIVHTIMAGASGMMAATIMGWQKRRVIEAETLINGSLAGLVSITASCHIVSTPMAVLIGATGALIMMTAASYLEHYGVDDGVGAVALHGFTGAWGTLALALFGNLDLLGSGLSRHAQLLAQLLGVSTAFVWGFGISYLILCNINRICPLRVTEEEEEIGLNISEHQAKTEVYDLFQVMDQQAKTQDFSLRVPEEPFTEVGKIARRYNQVMASLETYAHQLEDLNTNLEQTVAKRTAELTYANAELEKTNAELKRLDKLKDEFLANTSHELRTPLNSIIGLSEVLIEWKLGPLPEQVSDNLAMIASSGRRLYNLVSDILDFSKILHDNLNLNLTAAGLREVTEIVLLLCRPLIGHKNLDFVNQIPSDLPLLRADEARLQQILYNLVGNAVKFTTDGQIDVSAKIDPQTPEQVMVTVADTGIGIPENKYDSIFESFVQGDGTTAREYGGMGLGLAITKKLVELHGGKIWVESIIGQGTQFHFTLPIELQSETVPSTPNLLVLPAAPLPVKDSIIRTTPLTTMLSKTTVKDPIDSVAVAVKLSTDLSADSDWHQTCKILIVDDDPVNLRVLNNYLALDQYQVTQAPSGPDALALITADYRPDLIILDVMMPRMTGYEVTQTLRKKWQRDELPIVLLTAKNQLEDEVAGFKVGANDYLTKPVFKETLLARIETQLALRKESLERQQAEAERIQSEAANLAKSTFLTHMSHELRSPLNSIIGFAQLLNRDRFLQAEHRKRVGIINHSAEHLLSLINNILDISKIEAGKVTLSEHEFDLHSLLKQVLTMFEPKASFKELTLTLVQDPHLLQFVVADEVKLRQILINLIANSLKFTDQGSVTLTATHVDDEGMIGFEIQDTGPGIAAYELEQLFTPFEQTAAGRSIGQGTGLGLSICKKYAQLMGGDISVCSTVNQGSCFTVQIPMGRGSALIKNQSISDRMVIGLAPSQPKYRLLIVDDLVENTQLLSELCHSVGFKVATACNGVEAVEQWQTWQPHLIWMDLRMPKMDGFEATRQIRAASANVSRPPVIIALTASVLKEKREEILASGFDGFVAKPFNASIIWSTLSQYLGVEFIYDALLPESASDGNVMMSSRPALTSEVLATFPMEWLRKMHQTAARLKSKEVLPLIEQLPIEYREQADGLRILAENYEFAKILELLEPLVSRSDA